MADVRIIPVGEIDPRRLVDVINEAFQRNDSLEWFRWKHQEGPWGPSVGSAALDGPTVVGVRLLLPWKLRIASSDLLAFRATEAATVPRARGRGVFSALNRWMMDELPAEVIFSTPNRLSRDGYLKLGWHTVARVPHRWERLREGRPSRVRAATDPTDNRLETAWDREALRWRADPRSRWDYDLVERADAGLYFRTITRRGVRGVVPLGAFGPDTSLPQLWDDMVVRSRARFALRPQTHPTPAPSRLGYQRGESLIIARVPTDATVSASQLGAARWMQADLEAVI